MKNIKLEMSAGGVVYRVVNDVIEVKLITTKNWKYNFPKGHVEHGESIESAALREVLEEAGCEAAIELFLGESEWQLRDGGYKRVYMYLMKLVKDGSTNDPDNEIISACWVPINHAINLVSFPPMKKFLFYAIRHLDNEKRELCVNCFDNNAVLFDWCKSCLERGKNYLESSLSKKL